MLYLSLLADLSLARHQTSKSRQAWRQAHAEQVREVQTLTEDLAGDLDQTRTALEVQGRDLEQARRQAQETAAQLTTFQGRPQAEQEWREAAEAQSQALQDRLADLADLAQV